MGKLQFLAVALIAVTLTHTQPAHAAADTSICVIQAHNCGSPCRYSTVEELLACLQRARECAQQAINCANSQYQSSVSADASNRTAARSTLNSTRSSVRSGLRTEAAKARAALRALKKGNPPETTEIQTTPMPTGGSNTQTSSSSSTGGASGDVTSPY